MNALKFSAVLALLILTEVGRAGPLDTWTWRNPLPTGNDLNGIAYGNGEFVAVGGRSQAHCNGCWEGTIVTSADGVNWVPRQAVKDFHFYQIAYGNGQFVAVGGRYRDTPGFTTYLKDGTILTSTNGVNWVLRPSGATNGLRGSAYGNGQFVAVGDPGLGFADSATILTSTDGVNWVQRESGLTGFNRLFGIAYGNRQFVAVGTSIVTSANGLDWVQRQLETQDNLSGIAYGNGQFVAVSDKMLVLTSSDGVHWVERRSGGEHSLLGIAYGDGHFVAMGPGGRILESASIINLLITRSAGSGSLTLSLAGPGGVG